MNQDIWRSVASPTALQARSNIVWQIRQFFHSHGFAEVHTPTISRDTVVDRYIDPVQLPGSALGCASATADRYFLQTSPEFCMKRLLASGMTNIYQIGPAYRAGERGQYHNPEFTMLEWYRVGETHAEALQFLGDLVDRVLSATHKSFTKTETISYVQAFERTLALDPLTCSDASLAQKATELGLELGSSWANQSRDDWLNLLFAEGVQPKLGWKGPTTVTHYPATQAALAAISPDDPRTAERYELFVQGIELANGYHELLDPSELERRSELTLAQRREDGKPDLATDNLLLAAMRAGLPDACGCALGVDRLVMVALGLDSIDAVIPFTIERA
jgi:lysyl-tRNA synthetase class 2